MTEKRGLFLIEKLKRQPKRWFLNAAPERDSSALAWQIGRKKGGYKNVAKKLFVGGLSWDTTDASLRKAFESHGEVKEAKVITDRDTGRSRRFGFVTFVRDEEAKTAISEMNAMSLDGRSITVNDAQERGKPARRIG
jgi:cold-inducible RNA-binding protein